MFNGFCVFQPHSKKLKTSAKSIGGDLKKSTRLIARERRQRCLDIQSLRLKLDLRYHSAILMVRSRSNLLIALYLLHAPNFVCLMPQYGLLLILCDLDFRFRHRL